MNVATACKERDWGGFVKYWGSTVSIGREGSLDGSVVLSPMQPSERTLLFFVIDVFHNALLK